MSFILCFACKIYKILLSGSFSSFGIEGYPSEINTLGDHVRAARLDRELKQWEVADMLSLKRMTINKWEGNRGHHAPEMFRASSSFSSMIRFLSRARLKKK